MAHFAEIIDDTVTRVLVTDNSLSEEATLEWLHVNVSPELWLKCSYNNRIRDIFPGIGFKYDSENDVFYTDPILDVNVNEEFK